MSFELGAFYTRDEINAVIGSKETMPFLAVSEGKIVGAFLTDELNRKAPRLIYVGTGPNRARRAEQLATQEEAIPVFRKGNKGGAYATRFEYVGNWVCEKYDTDEQMILTAQEDSPKAIAGVLCMREVKQSKV